MLKQIFYLQQRIDKRENYNDVIHCNDICRLRMHWSTFVKIDISTVLLNKRLRTKHKLFGENKQKKK